MKKFKHIAVSLLLFVSYSISAQCPTGTSGSPFTSLGQARSVTSAGIYYFNLSGTAFSTYVDTNGYVMIAIDFGNGSGNLPQGTSVTTSSREILTPTVLSRLTEASEVRISHSGGDIDVITTNSTILGRVRVNGVLHQGAPDNTIADSWTGTEASAMTVNATCTTTHGTSLHQNIAHLCGPQTGFHWIPSTGLQRIRYSSGAHAGEIPSNESLRLWVRADYHSTCHTYVPDDNFEDYLETHDADRNVVPVGDPTSMGNGIANDNYVLTDRIADATQLTFINTNVADLTGIENFSSLQSIVLIGTNPVTSLNLTGNTNLTSIYSDTNTLSSININGLTNFTGINLPNNNVSSIDFSTNTALEHVTIRGTSLTSLNLNNNTALKTVTVNNTTNLTSLDLSNNTSLVNLNIDDSNIETVDMRNGNNVNFGTQGHTFEAENVPNLTCVQVDDVAFARTYFTRIDDSSVFSQVGCGETYVPDDNFEAFLEANGMGNGIANDNAVTTSNISSVTELTLFNSGAIDLTGIEDFTALQNIGVLGSNPITTADFSSNVNLREIIFFNISTLTSINVDNLSNLETLSLSGNNLSSIDVSDLTSLDQLGLNGANFSSIDLSNNLALRNLYLSQSSITSLDISNNTELRDLDISDTSISTLDISSNVKLTNLNIANLDNITTLDLRSFVNLDDLDISNMDNLQWVDLRNGNNTLITNDFQTTLKATNLPNLTLISVDNRSYSVATWTNIDDSSVFQELNPTTYVPDGDFEAYLESNGMGNGVANDDTVFTGNIFSVTTLNIGPNLISDLTGIEGFLALETLDVNGNSLSNIDVSNNTALTYLNLQNNSISSLDVSALTLLETLLISGMNTITAVDVSNNSALRQLQVTSNQVTSLDLSNNTALESLTVRFTNITNLDLSNNTALTYLDVQNSAIPSLDLTSNTALTELYAKDGLFSFLDVKNGNNTNMTTFDITLNTNLSCVNVDDAAYSTTNWTSKDGGTSYGEHCYETYVPDNNFEAFLEANGMGNGVANDDYVTTTNISAVTTLDVDNESIADMTGIEGFAALETLQANGNTFTSIDVSTNTALTYLDLRNNSILSVNVSTLPLLEVLLISGTNTITSVDVSNNPVLRTLQVTSNQVTSLDLSNNTALQSLTVRFTGITSLDLSNNTALTYLDIQNVSIPVMDLSNNTALTQLFAKQGALTSLNVKNGNNTNVTTFSIHTNPNLECVVVDDVAYATTNFTGIDAGLIFSNVACDMTNVPDDNFEAFLEANGMGNGVANDDKVFTHLISGVTSLNVGNQSISDLTGIEAFTALESLQANSNSLSTIDVSSNTALTYLDLRFNSSITTLDVSALTSLEKMYLHDVSITSLDVSNNIALDDLSVRSISGLTSIDISNNTALITLDIQESFIPSLDISNNTALTRLYASNGVFTSINAKNGNNTNMTVFNVNGNSNLYCIQVDNAPFATTAFTNKDAQAIYSETCGTTNVPDDNFEAFLEANNMGNGIANDNLVFTDKISSVTTLDISSQSITDITGIADFAALESLNVSTNNISAIDVSQLNSLEELYVVNTVITTLDVSSNTALRHLEVSGTNLTTLDLSNNPNMQVLRLINMPQLLTVDLKNGNGTNMTTIDRSQTGSITCVNVDENALNYFNTTFVAEMIPIANFNAHCFETYVPGDNFENYLETHDASGNIVPLGDPTSMGNGVANDDYVTTTKISSVTTLNVNNQSIADMTGLAGFAALEDLDAIGNSFSTIDVSANTALIDLELRQNGSLTGIDVSNLPLLESLNVNETNSITSVDVSNNTALRVLQVTSNQVTSVDVSNNPALEDLTVEKTAITSLDLSNNPALRFLDARDVSVPTLDLSNNPAITHLFAQRGAWTSVNLKSGGNTSLANFAIHTSPTLKCVVVDDVAYATTNFTNIDAGLIFNNVSCEMTNVPDDNFEAFLEANGMGNGVANDDQVFTHNIASVTSLDVDDQNITDLTGIEAFAALEVLEARRNTLTSIDVSANTALTYINIENNSSVTAIDVSTLMSLEQLHVLGTSITSIDVTNNTALTVLRVSDTNITSLDLSANTALENLSARNISGLTSLDLSANTALIYLNIQNAAVLSLDLSNNTALTQVFAKEGSFTSINIKNGNNTNLTDFEIQTNPNLNCVLVDDVGYANTNFTNIDTGLVFGAVSCNMTNVPDDNFEAYLEANGMGNGVANDDQVFTHNIASVIGLDVDNQNISDLTGLEAFTALEALNARNNGLTNINVSPNINLSHLFLDNNDLTSIDVSALPGLEEIGLTGNPRITSLNISSISALENIEIGGTGILSIDVSNQPQLISMDIQGSFIADLDLSQNPNVTTFRANNSALESLDIRNGQNTGITTFDTRGAINLECVEVDDITYATTNWTLIESGTTFVPDCSFIYMPDDNFEMYLETHTSTGSVVSIGAANSMGNGVMDNYVDPMKMESATTLNINNLSISDLTGIEGFVFLSQLNIEFNNITSLDLTDFTAINVLRCADNPLTSLNISTIGGTLQTLDISNTNLTAVDLSVHTFLTSFSAKNTSLTSLDVSNNTALIALDISDNTITTLNVGVHTNLGSLDISNTSISSISLAGNPNLNSLDVSDTSITNLDVSSNANITIFNAQNAALTSLNFKNGNNTNILSFNTTGSSSLTCVEVDDSVYSRTNWTQVDAGISFSDVGCATTTIPDDNFEAFLEANGMGNGIANDDLVFTGYISGLTSLDISNQNISSLNGIHDFIALEILIAPNNNFTNLITITAPFSSTVKSVDFSGNALLTQIDLHTLPVLEEVNLSNTVISSLNLNANTSLEKLNIKNTAISTLNISNNTALITLDIEGTSISSLSLTTHTSLVSFNAKNAALTSLNIKNGNNSNATLFDVTGNAGLTCITVDDPGYSVTNWTNIDAGVGFSLTTSCATTSVPDDNFEAFLEANSMGNGIANDNLVITGNIAGVTSLDISSQSISDLTGIEDFTALEILNASFNSITSVDFTSNTVLKELNLEANSGLTVLDVSYITTLENLNAGKTGITTIDLSQNIALTTIDFLNTDIVILDLSKNVNLNSVTLAGMASLQAVDLKNGTNTNITNFFAIVTDGVCFKVDDPAYSEANWTFVPEPAEAYYLFCDDIDAQIPDPNFEAYLETHDANGNAVSVGDANSMGNGIANDGYVLKSRISSVTVLNMQNQSIADMTGIEDFTSLQELRLDGNTGINAIDVSSNTNLVVLRLYQTNVSSIDVSTLSSLGDLVIASTQITSIDVSNNSALFALDMRSTNIPTVDLSQNSALTYLNALNASLTSLNVKNGNNSNVTTFELAGNTNLSCVLVDNPGYSNTNWTDVEAGVVFGITNCDMTNVPDDNFENYLETHDASGNIVTVGDITSLGNGVANDDHVLTSAIAALTELNIASNSISDLTGIEDFTALTLLNVSLNNGITSIDVSTLTSLESLNINATSISSLDVSNNTALKTLSLSNTSINTLNISSNTALESLTMRTTGITSLNLSTHTVLTYLNIGDNSIPSLDVTNNTALIELYVDNAGLTSLNVKNGNNTNMTNFDVRTNSGLTCITVDDAGYSTTNWTDKDVTTGYSETTSCATTTIADANFEAFLEANGMGNSIANDNLVYTGNIASVTSLDISSQSISDLTGIEDFTLLESLNVSNTTISALDLSNNTALTVLNAQNAALTTLDIKNGNNSNVTSFDVTGNAGLSCITVDDAGYSVTNWGNIDAGVGFSQTTSCATTSIPDANFETFLEANGMGNGIANDNLVITGNISGVTSLNIYNQGIADMTGIEDFTALEILDAGFNTFSTIDVSSNTALKDLSLVHDVSITSVDVSALTALERLILGNTRISTIDLSSNAALRIVNVSSTNVATVDLSNNPNLEEVYLGDMDFLTTVDLKNGNSSNITKFRNDLTYTITCVNVDESALNHFNTSFINEDFAPIANFNAHCFETQIPDNNFENYLETHDASGNVVPVGDPTSMGNGVANDDYVTTSKITGVTVLNMQSLGITDMTGISTFTSLQELRLDGNTGLNAIAVSSNTSLTVLRLSQTNVSSINVNALSSLEELSIASTQITSINLSNNTALSTLDIGSTNIPTVDLSQNSALTSLNALNASLTSLNVKNGNNTNVTTFDVTGNSSLSCIMVDNPGYSYTNWTDIDSGVAFTNTTDCTSTTSIPDDNFEAYLEANNMGNGIANDNLVYTGNISGITSLDISSQNISSLTGIAAFSSLTTLNVSSNTSLTSLDVSALTALGNLDISSTGVSSLDLTSNTAITVFNAQNAALTSLDIKNGANTSITNFNTIGNAGLECIQVDDINYSTTNWTTIDGTTSFSGLCGFTYVPDNNFETYLETHDDRGRSVPIGDSESLGNGVMDDYVTTSKIEALTALFISNESISDLTGIEDFSALRTLWVDDNNLTSLDVSNNTNLDDLNCGSNSLTAIDVSDLTGLNSLDISGMNGISSIDISNNTGLTSLDVSNTSITSLDLRNYTSLHSLNASNAQLTSLDLRNGNNTNMSTVQIDGNFDLNCVSVDDVEYATNNWDPIIGEYSLSCGETYVPDDAFEMYLETHNGIGQTVSMGHASSLGNGSMDNFITTSKLEFIFNLDLSGENIADLTGIKDFRDLSQLNISSTNLTNLDLSGLEFITHLYLSNTPLTSLNVSSHNSLRVLDISDTSITSIDVSSNSSLEQINIGNTSMTSIDLSNNTALTSFEMSNGAVTSLDVSNNTALTDFSVGNSASLTSVDLRNGNNTNMISFSSALNPNLSCIQVDNATYSTTNWTNVDSHTSFGESGCGVMITAKVFLHGAYDSSSSMMRADLGAARIPTDTPHTDGVAANSAIFDITGNNAIVDWVYVELRDKDDITSVVEGISAFVQRDGDIVGTDGISALTIDAASGEYYISVKHRNHIPIATDMAVSLSTTVTHIDFTNVNNIRGGTSAVSDINGTHVLIPGDVDGNGQVQLSDYFAGLALVGQPGYRTGDINMDGQVQLSDMLNILVSFIGKGVKF